MEERRLYEVRLATEERRREEERILQEHIEIRRREEERVLEEQRRREEERRLEERRLEEQRRLEERMQEEQRRREQRMREEQRRLEELRMDELRRQEEFRHKEEEERRLEQQRLQQEEHERQARLRAEQETQERRALQRQHDSRVSSERPQSAHEGPHHHSFTASTHLLSPHSAPATIELPQPVRPYPPISGPRKSDPIQIKRPVNHDQPSLHISSSAPSSSTDDERPAKKQRFSESPPPSSMEPYPRVVALPPPISTDFLSHRPGSSTVRRPGSGQGRRQPLVGFGDVVERERDKERERERTLADAHRIISSLGRRSPPGSQIGRATAAKKSDEARRADEAAAAAAIADVRKMEGASPSRDDRMKPPSSRSSDSHRVVLDAQTLPKNSRDAKETQDAAARQPQHQQDPHEWLLDHYGQPSVHHHSPLEPPRSLSPSTSPVLSKAQTEKARTPPVEIPKPIIALRSPSPDADAALERELAELMAEEDELAPVRKHETDDMDIDLAVAEILEEDDKSKVVPMDVDGADDVEDELLSLVDDRPPPSTTSAVAGRKVATPTLPVAAFKPPPVLKADEVKRPSPPAPTLSTVSAATSPVVRPPSTLPASERGSMPPPAVSRGKDRDEDVTKKGESVGATSSQAAKKKKDAGNRTVNKKNKESATSVNSQPSTNNKPQKVKAAGSKKAKTADGTTIPIPNIAETKTPGAKQAKSSASNKKPSTASHIAASRSRSTSVIPGGSVEPEPEPERKSEEKDEEKDEAIDDKLYCVCKTKYDEDRFMIACDRCDEWYHTTCVNMPDMEVELVDQFFCPPCIEQNPSLNLKTTYKQRCLNGLRHPDPDSSKACHKPARGAISKYCSDECGVEYMQSRIDAWAKKGGKKEELWESVKNSEKREGIAVCVDDKVKSDLDKKKKKQTKMDREMDRLQGLLNQVVKVREEIKTSMEIVVWRERLLQLASERAEHIDQCGWDQRLCFGDDEWQDFGAGVLESYDEVKTIKDENGMQVEDGEEEGEWWCPGQKSCKRHVGWQTLRYKDICKEREKKEELLAKMTNRERQLRKRIDDLTDPNGRKSNSTSQAPLKSSNTKLPNGHAKSRGTTETLKKGKKRKAPAS
ncbi:Set1 complex component spp1 [Leucoagaricus sp. SymC.cos]|nr:Set1 complex component spp1 [Leucoagaricus sp. SymC.cos]